MSDPRFQADGKRHMYAMAFCKSCQRAIPAKYFGIDDGRPIWMIADADPWTAPCGACGAVHDYYREDLKTVALGFSPPPIFTPWWDSP